MRISGCRLKEKTQDRLAEFFVGGVPGRSAADLARVNRKTAAYFFHRLRQIIARRLEDSLPVEGACRGGRKLFWRGSQRQTRTRRSRQGPRLRHPQARHGPHRDDPRRSQRHAPSHQPHKVVPDSIVYTDSYPAYDVLDVSEFHHHRIDHSDAYVLDRHNNINGIENIWNQANGTLSRYNGIPKAHFPLFLKEAEFRFNFGTPRASNAGPNSRPCQPHLGQLLPHLVVHRNNRSTLASGPDQLPVRARGTAHDDREAKRFPANAVKGWPIREPLADHPKEATNYHFRSADFSRQHLLTSLGGGSVRRLTPFSTSGLGVQCWIVECQRNADARRNCYPRDAAVNKRRSRCRVLRQSSLQCKSCRCCRRDRRPPVLTRMHSS